jgi:ribonuclease-3
VSRAKAGTDVDGIETALGYRFNERALLERALVHDSLASESRLSSNETLEFLGDAVIHLAVSEWLLKTHVAYDEGELSRARAALVSTRTLAAVAERLGLGAFVRLGKGEESSGGRQKPKILAACYEAAIGAIFLDAGYSAGRDAVLGHLEGELSHERGDDDYKTRLQEVTQARYRSTPTYRTVSVSGPDHARRYRAEVEVGGTVLGAGEGTSRKAAEQVAASHALAHFAKA